MNNLDLFCAVTLLGILKKQPDETLDDVLEMLVETGMFEQPQARQVLADLRAGGYVNESGLTMLGVEAAKEAEAEFIKAGEEASIADR